MTGEIPENLCLRLFNSVSRKLKNSHVVVLYFHLHFNFVKVISNVDFSQYELSKFQNRKSKDLENRGNINLTRNNHDRNKDEIDKGHFTGRQEFRFSSPGVNYCEIYGAASGCLSITMKNAVHSPSNFPLIEFIVLGGFIRENSPSTFH